MKAVVAAFNQEKALVVGAFSVITNHQLDLVERGRAWGHQEWAGAGVVRGLTYNYSTPNVVTK